MSLVLVRAIARLVLFSAAVSSHSAFAQPWRPPVFPVPTPAEQKLVATLDQLKDVECINYPLCDMLEHLRERDDIEIELDSPALRAIGVSPRTRITCDLRGMPLGRALRLMLRDVDSDLIYLVHGDVMLVTTTQGVAKLLEVRVYDVSQLLGPDESAETVGELLAETLPPIPHIHSDFQLTLSGDSRRGKKPGRRVIRAYGNFLLVRDNPVGHEAFAEALWAIKQGLASAAESTPTETPPTQ